MAAGDAQAEANLRIRDLAARLGEDLDWEFVCECGEPECADVVPLAADAYDDLRRLNLVLLAPGHPRARARTAREQASALRLEALALHNQAEHQRKRSARIAAGIAVRSRYVEVSCRTCGYAVCAERPPATCPMCGSMDWQTAAADEFDGSPSS
jgi:rubrerythrin